MKYWSKVLVISDNCVLIRQCYNEYILIVNFGHKNWAFDIKTLLSKLEFLKTLYKQKSDNTYWQLLNKEYMINQIKKYMHI